MQSQQHLRSVLQNSIAPTRDYRDHREDTNLLTQRIAEITDLVTSLNAAVRDLESTDLPALTDEFDFYTEVQRFEMKLIRGALRRAGGSQVKAARLLKLNATTLNNKLKTFNMFARER